MPVDFEPSSPEKEEVVLGLPDANIVVSNFTEYSFNSNFLNPTDGWSFTIEAERLSNEMKEALVPGAAVSLSLNGIVQSSGYIDSIEISASRQSGAAWRVEGRDRLGQAVDACADPTKPFKQGQTLADALKGLFKPFGWSEERHFKIDNDANRDIKTGGIRGQKLSRAKKHPPKPLKAFQLHQVQPYPREGVFQFAARLAERFGLWIWASNDGDTLIVGKPDFEVADEQGKALYKLRRNYRGTTNVLEGSVKFDIAGQPTIVIADGYSGGGEFGRGRVKSLMVNTAVHTPDPEFSEPFKTYKDAHQVEGHAFGTPVRMPRNRTLYLHDSESQTQEQLDNYVRREMALMQRKALTVSYTVEGHGQLTPNGFVPWVVDTTVDVEDELAGLIERLYVLGRTFNKSRSGGTTTHLELVRLYSIDF